MTAETASAIRTFGAYSAGVDAADIDPETSCRGTLLLLAELRCEEQHVEDLVTHGSSPRSVDGWMKCHAQNAGRM
ncbi:hypothetical protein BLM14_26580 (plasmid) [Phyllobacterium zundukense]|nr:hypothetical protein BLM14_26580 [Phyllobacterium zundukense]